MTTLPIDNHVVIPEYLLAVDAGVKTGLALFSRPDKLIWYRSHNMGSVNGLRKAAYNLIHSIENLTCIAVEGGGPVAVAWIKEAGKQNIKIISTDAGEWRKQMLFPREYRNSTTAKRNAIILSGSIIENSEAPSWNSPTHDAAEAILIGYWACKSVGWINKLNLINR
jgi:hypothetical protein